MRYRGLVLYGVHLQTRPLEGPDGRLATGPGPLDNDIYLLDTMILRLLGNLLGSQLGREGGGFPRPLETNMPAGGP